MKDSIIHLLLGSNLGDRRENLRLALESIIESIGSITSKSSIYETEPMGDIQQEPYYNQALEVSTEYTPLEVLEKIHQIETKLGRQRTIKNAPRTLDIDILIWGSNKIKENSLEIPHPRLHLRNFALIPLMEISNSLVHPIFEATIEELYDRCTDHLETVLLDDE